ncbi:DUF4355 domain-containing protein [Macrococcus armenti]|uniref:DUF4355 domain-containing protein n=2 Tax=Macrococcus armenti TaxID=2875764 RepID=UPI001CC9EC9E|nr:DUF4355 domain-containing protein [Macrococcus armenti]UBH18753.1 DUF4355 domain-containing protein [Macrococcus armenti]
MAKIKEFKVMKEKEMFKLNLQFFSDDSEGGNDNEGQQNDEHVTMTREELSKLIESERDKGVNKALEKERAQIEKIATKKAEELIEKDKRLSKLSDVERKEHEISEREKALQEKEAEIRRTEIKSDVINELAERKINTKFADFITLESEEKALEQINAFTALIDEVKQDVKKELTKQDTPRQSATSFGGGSNNEVANDIAELARKSRII